jgi:hypothetical protein
VRQSIRRGLVLAALAGTALVAAAPAAFAQTTSPEAIGIEGTGLLGVAPTPDATLSGNPNPANVVSVGIPTILTAGTLSASVTSNSATAAVQTLTSPVIGAILGVINGSAISSSCLANADGSFVRTTTIASLSIGGVTLPVGPVPANDTALSVAGIANITLNQQIPGPVTGSMEVNAIHIALLGALVGETINIASSTCGPFTADTPVASGKGLAIGLGLLGSVGVGYGAVYSRRRKASVL